MRISTGHWLQELATHIPLAKPGVIFVVSTEAQREFAEKMAKHAGKEGLIFEVEPTWTGHAPTPGDSRSTLK